MPEREVESLVNTRNTASKLRPPHPLPVSPEVRSDPGRAEGPKFDAVPTSQLRGGTRVAHQEEPPIPSSTPVTIGPEE